MQHAGEDGASIADLKDGVRNVWQQISTIAALVFPSTLGMIQEGGEVKPFYFQSSAGADDDGSGEPVVIHLQQAYLAAILMSLMFSSFACAYCLINFAYIECLSPQQAVAFFLSEPASIGGPLLSLSHSLLFLFIGGGIWMLGTYGTALGIMALSGIPFYIWAAYATFRINSGFNPSKGVSEEANRMLRNPCLLKDDKIVQIHQRLHAKMRQEFGTERPQAEMACDGAHWGRPSDKTPAATDGEATKESKAPKRLSPQQVAPAETDVQ